MKRLDDNTTRGKVYYSGRSKTLMAAIPKKFAYHMELEPGDQIQVYYDKKAKSLTVTKYVNGKCSEREKEDQDDKYKDKDKGKTTKNIRQSKS